MPKTFPSIASAMFCLSYLTVKISSNDSLRRALGVKRSPGTSFVPSGIQILLSAVIPNSLPK